MLSFFPNDALSLLLDRRPATVSGPLRDLVRLKTCRGGIFLFWIASASTAVRILPLFLLAEFALSHISLIPPALDVFLRVPTNATTSVWVYRSREERGFTPRPAAASITFPESLNPLLSSAPSENPAWHPFFFRSSFLAWSTGKITLGYAWFKCEGSNNGI